MYTAVNAFAFVLLYCPMYFCASAYKIQPIHWCSIKSIAKCFVFFSFLAWIPIYTSFIFLHYFILKFMFSFVWAISSCASLFPTLSCRILFWFVCYNVCVPTWIWRCCFCELRAYYHLSCWSASKYLSGVLSQLHQLCMQRNGRNCSNNNNNNKHIR